MCILKKAKNCPDNLVTLPQRAAADQELRTKGRRAPAGQLPPPTPLQSQVPLLPCSRLTSCLLGPPAELHTDRETGLFVQPCTCFQLLN